MLTRSAGLLCLALSLAACQTSSPASGEAAFTQPIAVQLPAHGEMPALTLILSVSHGTTVEGMIKPVGSALYKALVACPEVVSELTRGTSAFVPFAIESGRVAPAKRPPRRPTTTCLSAALVGDRVTTPPEMAIEVRAEILATGARP